MKSVTISGSVPVGPANHIETKLPLIGIQANTVREMHINISKPYHSSISFCDSSSKRVNPVTLPFIHSLSPYAKFKLGSKHRKPMERPKYVIRSQVV